MSARERWISAAFLIAAFGLFEGGVLNSISTKEPPAIVMISMNLSFFVSLFGCGYVAHKKGRTRWWALLGLLSWIGMIVALCLKNLSRRSPFEMVPSLSSTKPDSSEQLRHASTNAPPGPAEPKNPPRDAARDPRVEVGTCAKCQGPLKVRAHAVKTTMRLTCRCGHVNEIAVADQVLMSEPVRRSREPKPTAPVGDDRLLLESVDRLLFLYRTHPQGFWSGSGDEDRTYYDEIRQIGSDLDARGGFDLMLRAHDRFRAQDPTRNARNLELVWDRIGEWLG